MTALWIIAAYLAVGTVVTALAYEPEQGGWIWGVLLWPLIVYGIFAP